jgi:hypothetical protein
VTYSTCTRCLRRLPRWEFPPWLRTCTDCLLAELETAPVREDPE